MKTAGYIIFVYGIISLAGGVYGFASADSIVSLIAGGISGIILIIAGLAVTREKAAAVYISIIVALAVAVHFGLSFSRTPKLMPAGLMLLLSLVTLGFSIYALSSRREGSSNSKNSSNS